MYFLQSQVTKSTPQKGTAPSLHFSVANPFLGFYIYRYETTSVEHTLYYTVLIRHLACYQQKDSLHLHHHNIYFICIIVLFSYFSITAIRSYLFTIFQRPWPDFHAVVRLVYLFIAYSTTFQTSSFEKGHAVFRKSHLRNARHLNRYHNYFRIYDD